MIQRTRGRLRLCITLLVLNVLFIWGNSCLPASASGALSQWVRDLLANLFPGASDDPNTGHGLLRKLAHFTEFCCLGVCLSYLVRMLRTKELEFYALPLLGGMAVACVDETIQCFVPGRGPSILDVGIDTLGSALGIVLISLIYFIRKKSNHLEENTL